MEFAREFERLSAMAPEILQKRLTYLFIDGLKETIKSIVGAHEPKKLEDAIQKALKFDMHQMNDRSKNHALSTHSRHYEKGRNHSKDFQKDELCHHCKEPWECGHKCRRELKSYCDELKRKKNYAKRVGN